MSCPNIAWARKRAEELQLPALTSWLFVTIAEFADSDTLTCRWSQKYLAEKTRMCTRQVGRLLPDLVAAGCLEVIYRGLGRKLEYRLIRTDRPKTYDSQSQVSKGTHDSQSEVHPGTYDQESEVDLETYDSQSEVCPQTYDSQSEVDERTYDSQSHLPTTHSRTKYPLKDPLKYSSTESVPRARNDSLDQQLNSTHSQPGERSPDDLEVRSAGPPWRGGDRRHPANAPALATIDSRVTFTADRRPEVNGSLLDVVVREVTEAAEAPDGIYPLVNCTPLIDLLCEGYDPDDDICPVIKRIAAHGGRGKPMNYYATAVRREKRPSWKPIGTWGPKASAMKEASA